jgi:hypothetical protein
MQPPFETVKAATIPGRCNGIKDLCFTFSITYTTGGILLITTRSSSFSKGGGEIFEGSRIVEVKVLLLNDIHHLPPAITGRPTPNKAFWVGAVHVCIRFVATLDK